MYRLFDSSSRDEHLESVVKMEGRKTKMKWASKIQSVKIERLLLGSTARVPQQEQTYQFLTTFQRLQSKQYTHS
jgi:hypothetical protein